MVNIQFEILKKELKSRFGSKSVLVPLMISLGIPLLVFIPNLQEIVTNADPETEFMSLLFFLVIPVMVTTLIGINSFINEIRWKTIKTLLVAPISEQDIFLGKSLACIIPGVVTDLLLAIWLLFAVEIHSYAYIVLFFILGPLSVIFTTFLFIIGTSRFPSIAENGGAILMPLLGLSFIFMLVVCLRIFLQLNLTSVYLIMSLIITILSSTTIFYAKRWFNREILVLSI